MSYGESLLPALLKLPAAPMALTAWLVVAVSCAAMVRNRLRDRTRTPLLAALLFAFAYALRLAVPAGPMDFTEGERFQTFWSETVVFNGDYVAVQLLATAWRLCGGGFDSYTRVVTPTMGAASCLVAVVLARRLGAGNHWAWLAGLLVAVWPPHVRYSNSTGLTVVGALLIPAFLASVLSPTPRSPGRWAFLASLAILAAETRSEYGAALVLCLPAAWGAGWRGRDFATLAILGALPGLAFLASALQPVLLAPSSVNARHVLLQFFARPALAPVTWVAAGLVGLSWGRDRAWARVGALLAVAALVLPHGLSGGERNPTWGAWRLFLASTPILAAGLARLASLLPLSTPLRIGAVALVLAPALPLAPQLTMGVDLQAQHAFLERTAPKLVAAGRTLVVLPKQQGTQTLDGLDSLAYLALHEALGPLRIRTRCQSLPPDPSRTDVWRLDALEDCASAPDRASLALFLGIHRPAGLAATPLDGFSETIDVQPLTGFHQTQCPTAPLEADGLRSPPCALSLTWSGVAP